LSRSGQLRHQRLFSHFKLSNHALWPIDRSCSRPRKNEEEVRHPTKPPARKHSPADIIEAEARRGNKYCAVGPGARAPREQRRSSPGALGESGAKRRNKDGFKPGSHRQAQSNMQAAKRSPPGRLPADPRDGRVDHCHRRHDPRGGLTFNGRHRCHGGHWVIASRLLPCTGEAPEHGPSASPIFRQGVERLLALSGNRQ